MVTYCRGMSKDHPALVILIGVIQALIVAFIEKHIQIVLMVVLMTLIAFVLGCGIPILADYLISIGKLRSQGEYWAFIAFCILLVSVTAGVIQYESTRTPEPVIQQYAPDGVHVDYK